MFKENFIEQIKTTAIAHFQNMGFNEETIDTIVSQGFSDLQKKLTEFENELNKNQPDLVYLANIAHTIKGILGNLGLEEQANMFAEIEKLAQANKLEEIKGILV